MDMIIDIGFYGILSSGDELNFDDIIYFNGEYIERYYLDSDSWEKSLIPTSSWFLMCDLIRFKDL